MKNKKSQNQNSKIQNLKPISSFQTPNSHFPTLTTHHSGITLIALVVTVVVLLILAGVSLTLMIGDNNIFKLAKEAGDKTNEAIKSEQSQIDELNKWLTENGYGSENGGSGENPDTPTPETPKLEIGSTVTYNLVGDDYVWNKEYATSNQTGTETLSSKTGGAFRLTDWKVLAINGTTVTLVPAKSTLGTDGTSGTVRLQGAQGYNNSVKLLNEACSKLYGNDSKGITARSIKIEDIENLMLPNKLTEARGTKYKQQVANPYTTYKNYPVIYAQEIKAVIGNEAEKATGLGLSDPSASFIQRSEGTSTTSSIGAIATATRIQPYQTYWYKNNSFMQTAFKSYKGENTYYSLIMPQADSTKYWVASRCVLTYSDICYFDVSRVDSGGVYASNMYHSDGSTANKALALFPVVTLSSELLKPGIETDFTVQL